MRRPPSSAWYPLALALGCAGPPPASTRGDLFAEGVRPEPSGVRRLRLAPGVRPRQTRNAEVARLIGANGVARAAPEGYGVSGAGVRVGVWDEGHARASHVDLAGRVTERDLGGWGEHATHTTATIAGSGTGSSDARGMAPGASVWSFDWLLDAAEIEEVAAGISVSSNAYGPTLGWSPNPRCPIPPTWWGAAGAREDTAFGRYGREAAAVDAVVYRTDLLAVWAVGNERLDTGVVAGVPHLHAGSCDDLYDDVHLQELTLQFRTLGGAAVAKNVLTVGAANDVARAALTPNRVVPMDMSGFGPTDDGRIKPEIMAGGEAVRSASADGDEAYVAMSGTSSATAATVGAAALLTELYRRTHGDADPRGVEIKALLVHTAFDAGAPGPDYRTGYGLLDAQAAADLIAADAEGSGPARHLRVAALESANALVLRTDAVPAGSRLRVTLAWNDPPNAPNPSLGPPGLVNDLDLSLVAPDGATAFRPWSLDPAFPTHDAVRDRSNETDNVEVVDVDAADNGWTGSWAVRVDARSALWRGRAQPLAIVASAALVAPAQPALALPRYLEVDFALGAPAAPVVVALANRGAGRLDFTARSLTPWVAVSPVAGHAPAQLQIEVDTSAFARAGDYLGAVEIGGGDPAGSRRLGVVARATCEPDCDGIRCGPDPRCGVVCGRCGSGEYCGDGACRPWATRCPHASIETQLGPALVHGSLDTHDGGSGSCGGSEGWDVGLSWTAPDDGRFAFTTRGSDLDSVLYVRDGGCEGSELACNDDSGDATSALAVDLRAGQRVTLFVDSFDAAAGGRFQFNVARADCPNVDLGGRVGEVVARASTVGGVDELSGTCGGAGSEDVAFRWAAPAPGTYRFALFDPAFQAVLYVRREDCDGLELGCSAATDVGPVELDLAKGESIVVVIDGREGRAGDFTLDILDVDRSCVGVCGGTPAGGGCSCDEGCVAAGDCCADACDRCGYCRCDAHCEGRVCGDDGCGGDCGGCPPGEACADGACVPDACAGVGCDACSACQGGRCVALAEGAACEDSDLCTILDACRDGTCAGERRDCDDGFACTTDRCDARTGECEHVTEPGCCEADTACGDAAACPSPGGECGVHLRDGSAAADGGTAAGRPIVGGGAFSGCGCSVPARDGASRHARAWALAGLVLALRPRRRRGQDDRREPLTSALGCGAGRGEVRIAHGAHLGTVEPFDLGLAADAQRRDLVA